MEQKLDDLRKSYEADKSSNEEVIITLTEEKDALEKVLDEKSGELSSLRYFLSIYLLIPICTYLSIHIIIEF
jgi:hypothetical protein